MEENQNQQDNVIGTLDYWTLYSQAVSLSKENKNQEAIAIIDQLIKSHPDDASLYSTKGVCLYNLQSYDEALSYYNKATELQGPDAETYTNIAYIYSDREDYETSLKYCKMALEADPKFPYVSKEMGRLLIKEKKFDEALASLDNAISYAKQKGYQDPSFHSYKAKCYQGMGKIDLALQEVRIASDLLENNIIGMMSGGLIKKTKESIAELLLLESVTSDTQKIVNAVQSDNAKALKVVERFKALKNVKSMLINKKIDDLNSTASSISSETDSETTKKKEFLEILNKNPEKINDLLVQYPDALKYPETTVFIVNSMQNMKTELLDIRNQQVQQKDEIENIQGVLKDAGVYDKAALIREYADLKKSDPKIYEYSKVFYWTLINYFSAVRAASTNVVKGNIASTATEGENLAYKGMKTLTQVAGKIPLVSSISSTIDSLMDTVFDTVMEKRFEDRINALNKIIMYNKDPKAQLDDDFNLCIAKAANEVAKARREEILNPRPVQEAEFEKALHFFNKLVDDLKEKALGENIDVYESKISCVALKDSMLLIAYFYKNHKSILTRSDDGLHEVILDIMTTGKAEVILADTEKKLKDQKRNKNDASSPSTTTPGPEIATRSTCCSMF